MRLTPKLPDAELDVLASLHRGGPATARELRDYLAKLRPMTHGAMVTLLTRLESKKLVSRKKGPAGKAFIFSAVQPATKTLGGFMKRIVQRVFHGDSVALVTSLFETHRPTAHEVIQLQELLEELKNRRD